MRFSRSAIITTVAAIASAGALAATSAGPAAAMVDPVGTGTTTCSAGYKGTFTFNPALKAAGTATTEGVVVKLSFAGCSGGTPVPASGQYAAKGIVSGAGANNCANWFAPPVGTSPGITTRIFNQAPLDGAVAWSPTTISPSNVRFNNMRIKTGAGASQRLTFILPNTGAGVVAGSYAPASNLVLRVNPAQNYPALFTACGSAAGVPSVTIGPGPSTGTW